MDQEAERIVEALGGPAAVALLCKVTPQAVSQWKERGIPAARRQFLELLRPELFKPGGAHQRNVSPLSA
jgi:hypothetical protein